MQHANFVLHCLAKAESVKDGLETGLWPYHTTAVIYCTSSLFVVPDDYAAGSASGLTPNQPETPIMVNERMPRETSIFLIPLPPENIPEVFR